MSTDVGSDGAVTVHSHSPGQVAVRSTAASVGGTTAVRDADILNLHFLYGWLGSRVVSVLDSGAEGPGFKSQSRHCRVIVLGKLLTRIVPLFTKQQNWYQPS